MSYTVTLCQIHQIKDMSTSSSLTQTIQHTGSPSASSEAAIWLTSNPPTFIALVVIGPKGRQESRDSNRTSILGQGREMFRPPSLHHSTHRSTYTRNSDDRLGSIAQRLSISYSPSLPAYEEFLQPESVYESRQRSPLHGPQARDLENGVRDAEPEGVLRPNLVNSMLQNTSDERL
ncbi:hypothetical protein K435DRAFT_806816 [Dendrothele bispora CBS 962.96]|uniref:Uncharacterized protein n=1 Tax=Dendrothele bispora (strain CBS 962.96) TaxID=1314807 RepID=A0A4S8L715_DENBC|nr:hypothetical protein K435DRAFT_806816 [Dendrothele bispora CBS 962.96]